MAQGLVIMAVAAVELWLASIAPHWLAAVLTWVGGSTWVAAVAYLFNRPLWLGKRSLVVRLLLAPYLLFGRGVATVAQLAGLTERDEVVPGLWVGGFPRRGAPGLSQLDLTAELPRRGTAVDYQAVPMLDGRAMEVQALDEAVRWAWAQRVAGRPLLVHCAYGHGRSCTVACVVMVLEGSADDLEAAQTMVQKHRPRAGIRSYHRRVVDAWWTEHAASIRKESS